MARGEEGGVKDGIMVDSIHLSILSIYLSEMALQIHNFSKTTTLIQL